MVSSDDSQLVADHVSMQTEGPVIFPQCHDNLNYQNGVADTPEIDPLGRVHSNSFQQILEEHSRVQLEMMEDGLFAHTEDSILAYNACDGSLLPPIHCWGRSDDHLKTSTMFPPQSRETHTQPSVVASDLLQVDSIQDFPVYPIASQSITSSHPPLQSSSTDGSIFVSQTDPCESVTSVQKPDPKTYSPQTYSSNAESAPLQDDLPFAEPNTTNSSIHAKTSADAQTAFSRLIFFISSIPATFTRTIQSSLYWSYWNQSMVDNDTLGLLDLDMNELKGYFERGTNPPNQSPLSRSSEPASIQGKLYQQIKPIPMLSPCKPLSSFVDFSCKFPNWDFSPRIWNVTPNSVPKHSKWARRTMERSMDVLKQYGVNLDSLVTDISAGVFSGNAHSSISDTVIQ
ncbi:hypothetical protein JCM33374_g1973 [Metschnikowia sp. JCM 33374]|nr:hypothetical protein JCM33374_g1973 [Metschnikowia sp. JCM 33374]